MQTMTSREFNQRTSEAQKLAHQAPLLITKRGKPDLVVLNYADYQTLTGQMSDTPKTLLEAFACAEPEWLARVAETDLEIPPRRPCQRNAAEFD